jgi:hypothetical protein
VNITKRGPFGKLIKAVFVVFNLFMTYWLVGGWYNFYHLDYDKGSVLSTETQQNLHVAGGLAGTFVILVFWAMGASVLGGLMRLTRCTKITEVLEE